MERRQRRSSNPLEALGLFLTAIARRTGAHSLVVADDTGLLVSYGGRDVDAPTLAALGPLPERQREALVPSQATLHFCRTEVDGQTLHLAAYGGAPIPHHEVRAGLQRILCAA